MAPTPVDRGTNRLTCRACGTYVSRRFLRVFGDNDDVVAGCPNCRTIRELVNGGAVRK